jgi:hypothetical protein
MTEDQQRHDAYANAVSITLGIYDVALHFSIQTPVAVGADKRPMFETTNPCSVRMSPQHAKALAALLAHHITNYEDTHDITLPLPASTQKLWDERIK